MKRSRYLCISALLIASFILFLHANVAAEAVRNTLDLCARILIPSLFPYMVLSSLIVRTGAAEILGKPFAPLTRRLFRLPSCAGGAVILGILCGFPLGAQSACELYSRGCLTKKQAERLIPIANCAGSAFTIEIIGSYLWNSRTFGLLLYAVQLMASWLLGIVLARLCDEDSSYCSVNDKDIHTQESVSLGSCLADSIAASALSMLKICGFAAFFSVVASLLQHIFDGIHLPQWGAFSAAVLELTAASKAASETEGTLGLFLAGLSLGWAGLSVLFQCMHFTTPAGLSLRTTVYAHGIRGILCGIAAVILFPLCKGETSLTCMTYVSASLPSHALYAEIILLVLFCLFPLPRSLCAQKNKENTHSLHL